MYLQGIDSLGRTVGVGVGRIITQTNGAPVRQILAKGFNIPPKLVFRLVTGASGTGVHIKYENLTCTVYEAPQTPQIYELCKRLQTGDQVLVMGFVHVYKYKDEETGEWRQYSEMRCDVVIPIEILFNAVLGQIIPNNADGNAENIQSETETAGNGNIEDDYPF